MFGGKTTTCIPVSFLQREQVFLKPIRPNAMFSAHRKYLPNDPNLYFIQVKNKGQTMRNSIWRC